MRIDIFDYLSKKSLIYVKIETILVDKLKFLIKEKYGNLKNFSSSFLKVNYGTIKHEFRKAKYHHFQRLLKIAKFVDLDKEEIFRNINGFRVQGSHRKEEVIFPREVELNENFIEGYALYLAEGDTGFNGQTIPRKFRFTNTNLDVIRFFICWIKSYFPCIDFYVNAIFPPGMVYQEKIAFVRL